MKTIMLLLIFISFNIGISKSQKVTIRSSNLMKTYAIEQLDTVNKHIEKEYDFVKSYPYTFDFLNSIINRFFITAIKTNDTVAYLQLRNENPTISLVADSMNKMGDGYLVYNYIGGAISNQGYYRSAIDFLSDGLNDYQPKNTKSSLGFAMVLNQLGYSYNNVGEYPKAETFYERSLTILEETAQKSTPIYSKLLNNLAALYTQTGNYSKAEVLFNQTLLLVKKSKGENDPEYINSLYNLGSFYESMGDFSKAESILTQTLSIQKKTIGLNQTAYAKTLNGLALVYKDLGDYPQAEALNTEAITIRRKITGKENSEYAESLCNQASVYKEIGKYSQSESLYLEALDIYKKNRLENHPNYFTIQDNLAGLYKLMGDYDKSEVLFRDVILNKRKRLGDQHPDYALSLNNLAELYNQIGNYAKAEPLYIEAITVLKKINGGNHPVYATTINNLAGLYEKNGNYSKAESLFVEALAIRKRTLGEVHPDYAASLNNIALFYLSRKTNLRNTETLFKKALSIQKQTTGENHPAYATILSNLAKTNYHMGAYKQAEPLFQKALAIDKDLLGADNLDYVTIMLDLANVYKSMRNYPAAEKYTILSNSYVFKYIYKNFSFLSENEKMLWWEKQIFNFDFSASMLFDNTELTANFLQQCCSQQLQLKGFVLTNSKKNLNDLRKSGNTQLQQLIDSWYINKTFLAKEYSLPQNMRIPRMDSLENNTNDQEKYINLQSTVFSSSQQNQQVGFKQVQEKLKNDEAAIEFIRFKYYHNNWTDSILYAAFLILPNDTIPHFVPLCEEKHLSALLSNKNRSSFIDFYGDSKFNTDRKKSDTLFNLIWKPLQHYLNGIKKIAVAPAGLLNRIAFSALPAGNKAYLIDKYEIRQYSSIREIVEQKIAESDSYTKNAVLYGGIKFDMRDTTAITNNNNLVVHTFPEVVKRSIRGSRWRPLPGTLNEVNEISKLFIATNTTARIITDTDATEESFKLLSGHSPWILHLATHGFSLPNFEQKNRENLNRKDNQFTYTDNPMLRSGFIMAGANRVWSGALPIEGDEDGIVTAYEIASVDLSNTDLVVISACETALGDIKGTEGVFGLQRAFKLAGVKNMLLSLWDIPDKETSELMELFYKNKLKGKDNYQALHAAQVIMREKYTPYYWAAFELIE